MPTDAKERQESASLLNIDDAFKKIIIVKDFIKPKRNAEGIVTIGLIDFLLNPELLNWWIVLLGTSLNDHAQLTISKST